jgi:hypothetical protein
MEFYHKQQTRKIDATSGEVEVLEEFSIGFNRRVKLIKQDADMENENLNLAAMYLALANIFETIHPIHTDFVRQPLPR